MQRPLISVIVPCYNVARHIGACLDSILAQDWHDLEVIVIDDHSNDGTLAVVADCATRDSRVSLIQNPGSGVATARNVGLANAHGEWISFVDSDDLVPADYLSFMYGLCQDHGADIAAVQSENFQDGTCPFPALRSEFLREFSGMEAMKEVFRHGFIDTTVWGKLYRRQLWEGIHFPDGLVYEDLAVAYKVYRKASKVIASGNEMYYYRQHKSSIMGSRLSQLKIDSAKTIISMLENDIQEASLQISKKCRIVSLCYNMLMQIEPYDKDERFFLDRVKEYRRSVILDNGSRKKTRLALLTSYFGLNFTRLCFNLTGK